MGIFPWEHISPSEISFKYSADIFFQVKVRFLEEKREKKGVKQPFSTDKDYTIFNALLEILKKQDESFSSPSFQRPGSSRRILIAFFFIILGAATLIWVGYLA